MRQPFQSTLTAGDTWRWQINVHRDDVIDWDLDDPPWFSGGYTLKYVFANWSLALGPGDIPGPVTLSSPPLPWYANKDYFVGAMVSDGVNIQICAVAGTAGSKPPAWNQVQGEETADGFGTLEWLNADVIDPFDDEDSFYIFAPSSLTEQLPDPASLPNGMLGWACLLFDPAGNRTVLASGAVQIIADPAQASGADPRSWVKTMLDAIQANMAGTATRQEQEYVIHGRQLKLASRDELTRMENDFAARYRKELRLTGQLPSQEGKVRAAFGPGNGYGGSGAWR